MTQFKQKDISETLFGWGNNIPRVKIDADLMLSPIFASSSNVSPTYGTYKYLT